MTRNSLIIVLSLGIIVVGTTLFFGRHAIFSDADNAPAEMLEISNENEIFYKVLQALGGAKSIDDIENWSVSGKVTSVGKGGSLHFGFKEQFVYPDKLLLELSTASGLLKSVVSGNTGSLEALGTRSEMPGSQIDDLMSDLYRNVLWMAKVRKNITVDFLGESTVGQDIFYNLEIVREKTKATIAVNTETMLPARVVYYNNGKKFIRHLSDYRKVQNILVPYQIDVEMDGTLWRRYKHEVIELNARLDDRVFSIQ